MTLLKKINGESPKEGPDKGWAWMVAFAACGINFIMAGLGRMSGILYVAFIDLYGVDRKGASLPFSVRSSTRNLLGPAVGILGQKYGIQVVIISGSIMSIVSSALCFFAKDIGWITILWGGLSGIGTALTTVLVQVVIGQYFKKYRTTAAGMGFSGGCVGSFLFPALMEWLLNNYGIGGTFLIISGIIMHTIPAAMILRKPPWLNKTSQSVVVKVECDHAANSTAQTEDLSRKEPDIQFLREKNKLLVKMLTEKHSAQNNTNQVTLEMGEINPAIAYEVCIIRALENIYSSFQTSKSYDNIAFSDDDDIDRIFDKQGIKSVHYHKTGCYQLENTLSTRFSGNTNGYWTKRNSISDISNDATKCYVLQKIKSLLGMDLSKISSVVPEERETEIQKVMTELRKLYDASTWSGPNERNDDLLKENNAETQGNNSKNKKSSNSFGDHIKTAFRLFGNPLFLMVCMCRTVHFLTFLPVVTTIVDFAKDRGFREEEGIYVIGALSLGDLIGRLCLGWVTDRGLLSIPRYMLFGMIIQGATTATLPVMSAKAAIYVCLCVFGVLQGSLFVRHPVLVQSYISNDSQSIAMGCINFFPGILGLALPLYIGYFRDTLGTYSPIFFINGAVGALVGILWSFEPYFLRCFPAPDEYTT
ncbi:uncharacterized protein TNIN_146881 [Trichonephila inaurata madagascariensis]|uniref:Monocarboxylate transporter 9 n=1 Tax=Trichonephila inaurata madagascariensis TaxID=2747483 RepID=A0A8X6XF74_9ARAC|nr:uncharacterized protein TNIN_146881 [Trichonephila inaurata madagascariensis]